MQLKDQLNQSKWMMRPTVSQSLNSLKCDRHGNHSLIMLQEIFFSFKNMLLLPKTPKNSEPQISSLGTLRMTMRSSDTPFFLFLFKCSHYCGSQKRWHMYHSKHIFNVTMNAITTNELATGSSPLAELINWLSCSKIIYWEK